MKYFFFLFLVFNFTCKAQVVTAIDYNVKTLIGDVDRRDTICFSEIERAKNDFYKKPSHNII